MLRSLMIVVFIIYLIVVSYFCLSKPSGIIDVGSLDKAAHILGYTVFAILSSIIAKQRFQLYMLLALCALYGIVIEYLQGLTGYRTASINDQLANLAGLITGLAITRIIHHFSPLPAFAKKRDKAH